MRWGNSPPYETLDCAVSGYLCLLTLASAHKQRATVGRCGEGNVWPASRQTRRNMASQNGWARSRIRARAIKRSECLFNQLNFVNDIHLWGSKDYWATPLEFLGSNAGDCEDFTIAKYFSLLELGVSDKKLRLVYVKAIELNQFHMVLAYYSTPSAEPVILDNINPQIKPASKRKDLLPIYSFNGKNLWLMKSNNGQLAGDSSRLSLWNDLRARERSLKLNKPLVSYDE